MSSYKCRAKDPAHCPFHGIGNLPLEAGKLSRTVSYALRHHPEEFDVVLDSKGWTALSSLASGVSKHFGKIVTAENVASLIYLPSDKQRYEVKGSKIRAVHGHSVKTVETTGIIKEPPTILYHGTVDSAIDSIKEKGLISMSRQYVHLSSNPSMAENVGNRRNGELVILRVRALDAHKSGIVFQQTASEVWLAPVIPSKFINFN